MSISATTGSACNIVGCAVKTAGSDSAISNSSSISTTAGKVLTSSSKSHEIHKTVVSFW